MIDLVARANLRIAQYEREISNLRTFLRVCRELGADTEPQASSSRPATAAASIPPEVAAKTDPVANVEEEANGAIAVASDDPASRDADDADRQRLAASGFTGEDDGRDVEATGGAAPVITNQPETAERGAGPETDPASDGDVASPVASPSTLYERVKAAHAEHPAMSARELADHIGAPRSSVSVYLPKVKREAVNAALKAEAACELPDAPKPAPTDDIVMVPEIDPNPISKVEPVRKRPKGTRFRLTDGKGNFLHMSGQKMVAGRTYAWTGTEAQLLGCRKAFPLALDLVEEVVEA